MLKALAGVVLTLLTSPLLGADVVTETCHYRIYKPDALKAFFTDMLPRWGLAPLPASFRLPGEGEGDPAGTKADLIPVTRGTEVVATLAYTDDPLRDSSSFELRDARGASILSVVETRENTVKHITIKAARDAEDCCGGHASFEVFAPNVYVANHLVYGAPAGWGTFSDEFEDTVAWVEDYLKRTQVTDQLVFATSISRFNFAVATNPHVVPYLDLMRFSYGSDGVTLIIDGIIPSNEIYDQIFYAALDVGLYRVDLRARIDGRYLRVDTSPRPYRCQ